VYILAAWKDKDIRRELGNFGKLKFDPAVVVLASGALTAGI